MAVNRGKKFEQVVRESFERVPGVSIDRLNDNTSGFKGIAGICDFIVYKEPYEYYIECKSVHGNTLPFSNITDTQWNGLLEKSKIQGVYAGVICWWIDRDTTKYIPIQTLQLLKDHGYKSLKYNLVSLSCVNILGTKKRIYFDYNMEVFFNEVRIAGNHKRRSSGFGK